MRKFLPYIFVFIVILGIFVPVFSVDAQATLNCKLSIESKENDGILVGEAGAQQCVKPSEAATQAQQLQGDAGGSSGCNMTSGFDIKKCVTGIFARIAYMILTLMAFVLWLSGVLLEFVLSETIIKMKEGLNGMTGINIAWKAVRDLINISFIFILLYESIKIIIGLSSVSKAKQVIIGIIVTSILINFSVFITKVVIDASNVVTIGFYKSITDSSSDDKTVDVANIKVPTGISGAYINALRIGSFWKTEGLDGIAPQDGATADDNTKLITLGIMGSILLLIISFIFFAISMMLIIRYIVLIFLLILSPIGFLGFGLPQLKGKQSEWWKTLMGQAMFAPIFMIMTWITLTLLSNGGFTGLGDMNYQNLALKGTSSNVSIIFNFIVVIGFTIMSLTVSKSFASQGSTQIAKMTGSLTTFAGGALMGGAAGLGRNTVGRLGNRLANNEDLKDAASRSGLKGFGARLALKTSDKAAASTFDARNTKMVGSPGWAAKTAGFDLGKGDPKKNFRSLLDAKAKKEESFTEKLKPNEETEKEFKKDRENYLNSDEYKNSDTYKKAEQEKAENEAKARAEKEALKKAEQEKADLEEKAKIAQGNAKQVIADKIKEKNKEIENKKKIIEEINSNNKFQKEKEEFEKKEKGKSLYKERADSYAKTIENPGWLGKVVNAVNTANMGDRTTKADRAVIGKRIRKKANAKSEEEQLAELAAKVEKKKKDKEAKEKGEETKEGEKKEEQKEGGESKTS